MSDAILGLISGKTFADESFYNRTNRRRIFRDFPTGQFPLTGLLSLMDDEACDSYKFGWFEKRFQMPETKVISNAGNTGPISTAGGNTAIASPTTLTTNTIYRLAVANSADFQLRQVIQVTDVPLSPSGTGTLQGIIESIPDSTHIEISVTEGVILLNTHAAMGTAVGLRVTVVGNASAEGVGAGTGKFYPPIDVENQTQIFRNAFEFTATALKIPTEFDSTGIYAESAEDTLREHMTEMEMAFLFGIKGVKNVVIDGVSRPRRQTGGILWFMREWERADSPYRGGTGAPALTSNSDDEKRIINLTGSITEATFDSYLERCFRTTNSKSFEKIAMCGNGALAAINNYLKTVSTLNKDYAIQKVYGMNVLTWETPWGTIHFKTHPLFNRDAALRKDMFIIDVNQLKYRYLTDRDTTLLPNRQANDFDGRKDEWLTEAGLEINMPEYHMYLRNMTAITSA
jgi:hypothetical protein